MRALIFFCIIYQGRFLIRVKNPNAIDKEAVEAAEEEQFVVPQGIGVKRKITDTTKKKSEGEADEKKTKLDDNAATNDDFEYEDEG